MELKRELQELGECQAIEARLKEMGFTVRKIYGQWDAHGGEAAKDGVTISWWHNPRVPVGPTITVKSPEENITLLETEVRLLREKLKKRNRQIRDLRRALRRQS